MRGKFITIEGGEGCGKSTQTKLVAEKLRACGIDVLETREPGGTYLAEKIRALVREEYEDAPNARAETLLFLAARAQVCAKVIAPALQRGTWVVCDRFADSTFAYQGYGRGLNLEQIRAANLFATEGLMPDLTILLDVPLEVSSARLAARQKATQTTADRMEQAGAAFHARLKAGFRELALAEPNRFAFVEASGAPTEVLDAIWHVIEKFYPQISVA